MNAISPLQDASPLAPGDAVPSTVPVRSFKAILHHSLEEAEKPWRAIEQNGISSAFQRYDWASLVVRRLVGKKCQFVAVEVQDADSGKPLMLMPLTVIRRRGYAVIEWLNGDVCDYSAPILAAGENWTAADMHSAWTAARSVMPAADVVWIDQIPSEISRRPNPLAALPAAQPSVLVAFGLPIEGDPDTVFQRTCPPSFIKDLAKKERRLNRLGQSTFVEADTPELVKSMFRALREQRAERFRKLGRFDLLARTEIAAFYRAAAIQGLQGGPVRMVGLRVGEEWIAIQYGLLHQGTYQGLLLTMAEGKWTNSSPGLLVEAKVLGWARRNDVDYFDMSVGDLPYKHDMGGKKAPMFKIACALTPKGHLIVQGRKSVIFTKAWLKAHPELFDSLRSMRQWARRQKARLTKSASTQESGAEADSQ